MKTFMNRTWCVIYGTMCIVFLLTLSACHRTADEKAIDEARKAFDRQVVALTDSLPNLTESEFLAYYLPLVVSTYEQHKDDVFGAELLCDFINYANDPEKAHQLYDQASRLVQEDKNVCKYLALMDTRATVAPGMPYKEVCGIDVITGDSVCLSQFLGKDKPVLIDFWASWCSPCRELIKTHLMDVYAEGKVTIVGIAVWEDDIEDTRRAMDKLGVQWPVIYTGGREASPSMEYGVFGIPTTFLISPEGIILPNEE